MNKIFALTKFIDLLQKLTKPSSNLQTKVLSYGFILAGASLFIYADFKQFVFVLLGLLMVALGCTYAYEATYPERFENKEEDAPDTEGDA